MQFAFSRPPASISWPTRAHAATTSVLLPGIVLATTVAAIAAHLLGWTALALPLGLSIGIVVFLDARAALAVGLTLIAVVGSETKAGPVLLTDATALLGLAGIASTSTTRLRITRPTCAHALPVAVLALALLIALADRTPSALILADLHGVVLPFAFYVIARRAIPRLGGDAVVIMVLLATALAAAKALAIALLSPSAAVGPDSIWQAYVIHDSLGIERVVLVGGDTLLALGPALCVTARRLPSLRAGRWVALLVLTGLATGATGTRTNIIAGTIALLAALALDRLESGRAAPVGRLIAGMLAGLTILVVAGFVVPVGGQDIAQGVTARFSSQSSIQQSLQYRADESARLEQALQGKMALGLGAGGTFVTEVPSAFGFELGPTLWAHNGYLWIMLKVGIVGLILLALSIWLVAMRLWQRRAQTLARAGLIWLMGILVLSISTNRFNDAGAGVLLALTFAAARPRFTGRSPEQGDLAGAAEEGMGVSEPAAP
jgi:hypothetical protein